MRTKIVKWSRDQRKESFTEWSMIVKNAGNIDNMD